MRRQLIDQSGVALLLVLWVITLLAVVCAEFSRSMRTELTIATNYSHGAQASYAAEAGINRAIIELMRSASPTRIMSTGDEEDTAAQPTYWDPGAGAYQFDFAGSRCDVEIEDEGNKVSINTYLETSKSNPTQLKQLLEEKVGLEEEARDIVADSLIDWYDRDSNVTGVNGAEQDYYDALDEPYQVRNREIPVLEELLLVRGVDETHYRGRRHPPLPAVELSVEDFEGLLAGQFPGMPEEVAAERDDGEVEQPLLGLADIFSADSTSRTFSIDVNTASASQLQLLQGMDADTARQIVAERRVQRYQSVNDRLPQYANYAVWKDSIKAGRRLSGGVYRIRATGYSPDGRVARTIVCVVQLRRTACTIQSWRAED